MIPSSSHTKRLWLTLLLLLLPCMSTGQGITPEDVKASYLLQLRKFVWIGEPSHRVQKICYYEKAGVPENESVGQILKHYLEKTPADELSIKWYQAISDFSGCDILYIPAEEEDNVDNILTKLRSSPTLTVSSAKRFIFRGGMIGFVVDDANHIKMEGNLRNMRANNVEIDTQVLEIMQQVVGK